MPQFPIKSENIKGEHAIITDKTLIKHICSVLRLKNNDELLLIDEHEMSYVTTIEKADRESISAKIVFSEKSKRKLNFQLDLLQCSLKAVFFRLFSIMPSIIPFKHFLSNMPIIQLLKFLRYLNILFATNLSPKY